MIQRVCSILREESTGRRERKLLTAIICCFSLVFFLLVGERGYYWFRDSSSYVSPDLSEGVMWLYPLFLNILRVVFGEDSYLHLAAVIQSIFAAISVSAFTIYIGRTFHLKNWEFFLIWLATLLPYSTELPGYLITHSIQTESLSFSLFYWYVICACEVLLRHTRGGMFGTYGFAFLLASTRPQLMLLYGLSGLLLICFIFQTVRINKVLRLIVGVVLCGLLSIVGLFFTLKVRTLYMHSATPVLAETDRAEEAAEVDSKEADRQQLSTGTENGSKAKTRRAFVLPGQFGTAIFCRTFYEADPEDEFAYEDEDERIVFKRMYEVADNEKLLYTYARPGLRMWNDLTQTDIYSVVAREMGYYLDERYPDLSREERGLRFKELETRIALKELSLHFGRFCYHSFRLMIPGWIACIFFNIYGIYLFCHIFVLFLYLSAIGMGIWIFRKHKEHIPEAKLLLASVCSCILFVVIVNIIFFGMQRYFIYNMGVFWCAYYLNVRVVMRKVFKLTIFS